MRYSLRLPLMIAGVASLVFGFFSLNYTKMGTVERHTAFAAEHGLPSPSRSIFYGGAISLAVGAGAIAYAIAVGPVRERGN